jgi:uncharacterized protein (TIGR02246 family)
MATQPSLSADGIRRHCYATRGMGRLRLPKVGKPATSPTPNKKPSPRTLRELHREFVAAYNKGNAEAVAAFYAPDADFVGIRCDTYHGRAEIEKRTANFFAQNKGAKLKSPFGSLRFITPDVAISDRSEELTPTVEDGSGRIHATVVYVKRDGKWLQASVRLMVPFHPSNR